MEEYISKQAAYRHFSELEKERVEIISKEKLTDIELMVKSQRLLEITGAKYFIADMKPADVTPVVHGRWEWFEESCGNPDDGVDTNWGWRCSACKEELGDEYDDPDQEPDFDFCPRCGANMDLEVLS